MTRRRFRRGRRSVLPRNPAARAMRRQRRAQWKLRNLAGKVEFFEGFDPKDDDDEHVDEWNARPTPSAR